ncbi:hypothetical protein [Aurantivibrio infirmus]
MMTLIPKIISHINNLPMFVQVSFHQTTAISTRFNATYYFSSLINFPKLLSEKSS